MVVTRDSAIGAAVSGAGVSILCSVGAWLSLLAASLGAPWFPFIPGFWGASLARTPRVLMDGWLHSTGHRENLFRSEWREQGLALVEAEKFLGSGPAAIYIHQFGA